MSGQLVKSSLTVGGLTLVSRVFGFIRDMLVAYFLGATAQTDAFFVAIRIPNLLRRLFAEGAFNAAFLPMFAGMLKTEGEEVSLKFASQVGSYLLMVLLVVTALCMIFTPELMDILAPGFSQDPIKYTLTITLTRITFPYIIFISLVCLLGGILNSTGKFAVVAMVPIIMNITMIVGLFIFRPLVPSDAHALSAGVTLAGVTQFLWLVWFCRKAKMLPRFGFAKLTPQVKKLLLLIAPAALGASVGQVNVLMDTFFASNLGNAISYLYYADRIYEMPIGVIGVAVGTALLPTLSKHARAGDKDAVIADTNQALMLLTLFGLPAAVALATIATPIIQIVFERGAFLAADTKMVVPALIIYCFGLPAYLALKVFTSSFYAEQNTKTPMKVAVFCMGINFLINFIFIEHFGYLTLAASSVFSAWLNVTITGALLYKQGNFRPDRKLMIFILKSGFSCTIMALVLYYCALPLRDYFMGSSWQKALSGCLLISVGGGVYFACLFASRAAKPEQIFKILKKKS